MYDILSAEDFGKNLLTSLDSIDTKNPINLLKKLKSIAKRVTFSMSISKKTAMPKLELSIKALSFDDMLEDFLPLLKM